MKQKSLLLASCFFSLLLSTSCLKDSVTKTYTYTIYRPEYKTSQAVRDGIKNDAAQPVTNPGKMYIKGNYIFLNDIGKGIYKRKIQISDFQIPTVRFLNIYYGISI